MKPAEACAPREYINPAHPGRFASSEPTAGSGIKIMMGHFCDLPLPGLFGTKIYDLFISATLTLTGENAKEAHG
jgi:hypothetical protein